MSATPLPSSIVRELLQLPEIGGDGVEHSIVFYYFPNPIKDSIRSCPTEQDKFTMACGVKNLSPVFALLHEHYVAAPARRKAEGLAFPNVDSLDNFPLPGVVKEGDRAWIRPGCKVTAITLIEGGDQEMIHVTYEDGEERMVSAVDAQNAQVDAKARLRQMRQAAMILSLQ